MTPQVIHRYEISLREAIEALLGEAVGDCERMDLRVDGDAVIVDIVGPADTPTPAPATPPAPPPAEEKRKGGDLARKAGILCGEKGFQAFAEVKTQEAAKAFVYQRCGIESRVDLDHDTEAALRFRDLTAEYDAWLMAVD